MSRRLLSLGGELKDRRVLDLGCGRGETARLLRDEYDAAVTGVDLSEEFINECRGKWPDMTFICADAQDLPFRGGSFDIIVSECCFSVFADPEKAFREAERVLSDGGILLLSDLWTEGRDSSGSGMVRCLYSRQRWLDMVTGAGFTVTGFHDVRSVLTGMYVQMILDLGREGAQKQMGLCMTHEEMKALSYMMLSAVKNRGTL
ncbi:MAG: class I SAM-dependent methyltransferase [Solobacterium sp.]|nr:class I SAM-dependent methyltransferase [Solobacterium sp.]